MGHYNCGKWATFIYVVPNIPSNQSHLGSAHGTLADFSKSQMKPSGDLKNCEAKWRPRSILLDPGGYLIYSPQNVKCLFICKDNFSPIVKNF